MFSCIEFHCVDDCCQYGVDILPQEYTRMISDKMASCDDFTGPVPDENGDLKYRTRLGPRGCIFLLPRRGCRLHGTGYKPVTCRVFPRDIREARNAYREGYLPCYQRIIGGIKYGPRVLA